MYSITHSPTVAADYHRAYHDERVRRPEIGRVAPTTQRPPRRRSARTPWGRAWWRPAVT